MDYLITQSNVQNLQREVTDTQREITDLTWRLKGLDVVPEGTYELGVLEGYQEGIEYALKALELM